MAAVEVTISGLLYDKLNRTTQNVVLIGEASLTGVGIGGGPIIPPVQPPGGGDGKPPGIWGGSNEPFPTPPIYLPPGWAGKPPEGPADDNGFIKPPPPDGGWAYHEDYGWMYSPSGSGGKPNPAPGG